ncbi:hypothetical protein AB205_0134630, partial [Aquarana catesbeiana]
MPRTHDRIFRQQNPWIFSEGCWLKLALHTHGHTNLVGNSEHLKFCVTEIPTENVRWSLHTVGISDNKLPSNIFRRKIRPCVRCIMPRTHDRIFIFLSSSYVLYVTAFLTFGISDKICVTVCMQDKFEPTSVGKKTWMLLLENPI